MSSTAHLDTRTSIGKALDLLRAFGEDAQDGLGVSELARRANLSKSTAHRLLGSMEDGGAIARAGKLYRRGSLFAQLQTQPKKARHNYLREMLTPHLADLYLATGLTTHLAVLEGEQVVYLNKLQGAESLRSPVPIGGCAPVYSTAVGKAMLAHDQAAVRRVQNIEFVRHTRETIASVQELMPALSQVRSTGVAIDRGETVPNVRCLAAPVLGPQGRAAAAISVSLSTSNDDFVKYSAAVTAAARAASRTLTLALATQNMKSVSAMAS